MKVVTLCTGNVARSVMLGVFLHELAQAEGRTVQIRTAGTHVAEGTAISGRTRDALASIEELGEVSASRHRSRQLTDDDVNWADVIVCAEADHVSFVHRTHEAGRDKAVSLAAFVRDAPLDGTLNEKVRAVAAIPARSEDDVVDPAGGDQAMYDACARQLWELAQAFLIVTAED